MNKYSCEKCGKEFKQKGHYTKHLNKKNPCVVESKIKQMIDDAVKEKLVEIGKVETVKIETVKIETVKIEAAKTEQTLVFPVEPADIIMPRGDLVKQNNPKKVDIVKPILKWVGGKTQILDKLISEFPIEINNYREIFLGGGSVLLGLLSFVKAGIIKVHKNIYAYDLNEPLIYVYKNIQTNHNTLYDEIQKLITEFNSCGAGEINRVPKNIDEAKVAKENYYYWIRSEYNKLKPDDKKTATGSAMFIFLNKTCFRGVFRVGSKGFNVPYGHYNNPEIINKSHLDEIHDLIKNVIFECCDFSASLTRVEPNDYVYLDPPYAPETNTSFVGYNENGFNIDSHNNLFQLIHKLTEANTKILLSNSDVPLVRDSFKDKKYNVVSILCKRSINSKKPEAKTKEVIIRNY